LLHDDDDDDDGSELMIVSFINKWLLH